MMPGGPRLGLSEALRASEAMRLYRARHDLSRAAFGAVLGKSPNWVYMREAGSVRLRMGDAEKVAAALGTDLAGLLGGAT